MVKIRISFIHFPFLRLKGKWNRFETEEPRKRHGLSYILDAGLIPDPDTHEEIEAMQCLHFWGEQESC